MRVNPISSEEADQGGGFDPRPAACEAAAASGLMLALRKAEAARNALATELATTQAERDALAAEVEILTATQAAVDSGSCQFDGCLKMGLSGYRKKALEFVRNFHAMKAELATVQATRVQRHGSEAYETMTPGQILRVEYALTLRQLAAVMKADPTGGIGMDIYGLLENALEQRVNELVQAEVHRQYDRGFRDGKADADSGRPDQNPSD